MIDDRIRELGLALPEPFQSPTGAPYPFRWARRHGDRVYVAGHLPLAPDGTLHPSRGKVGAEVTAEDAATAARLVVPGIVASLRRAGVDPDRAVWLRALGLVNAAPGFTAVAGVMNAFSTLVVDLFGADRGAHARSVAGVAELPFDVAVEVEAEIALV
jgi:enamine deaminase RidA (YjgF/YER057c/UK114 family)